MSDEKQLSVIIPRRGALPVMRMTASSEPKEHEIRVKMLSMGYCERDKSIINGQKTDVQGRIGHEGAGIVVRRDAGIQYLETEQPVVILPFINKHSIGYDWPEGGKGIFSNYPVIPGNAVYPIQKDMISPYDEFLHIL